VIRLKGHGASWELAEGFEPILPKILAAPGLTIKESPTKLVAVHAVNRARFYVKSYRHSAVPFRPLKFYFKSSQGRNEWALAQKLDALAVPIVRHLAYGERWTAGGLQESILITEGFDGAPLDRAQGLDWKPVTEFLRRLHECGVLQRDLHPGNILRNPVTGEMRLVDLHGTIVKSSLTADECVANLAFLRIFLPIPVPVEVERQSARRRKQYFAHRARRCLKHNREFAPKILGDLEWRVRLPFFNPAVENILRDPDAFLVGDARILKPGRSSTVGMAGGLVLKRYNFRVRKPENLFKDLFRQSKARRAFLKSYHLELVGIPSARPIATADVRRSRVLLRSYFLMEEIPGATDLGKWRGGGLFAAHAVAELLAGLHNEGFTHRDLKETNIVVDHNGRAVLLDLDGLEYIKAVPNRRAAADLERLARAARSLPQFSRVDWLNFLRRYCKVRGIRPRDLTTLQHPARLNRSGF